MSSDSADDTPPHPTPPASIWEPLDGSTPPLGAAPTYRVPPGGSAPLFPGRMPGQAPPAPDRVAAAYAKAAQSATTFTLAGWWPRCWAFLIDSALFVSLVIGLTLAAGVAAGLTASDAMNFFLSAKLPQSMHEDGWLYAVLVVGRLLLGVLPALCLWRWDGRTPGKRMVGLRVMRASGEPMTLRIALRREVLGRVVLLQLLTLFTLGLAPVLNYLWPLWDQQRRAGHDLYADTRVVVAAAKR